MKHTLPTNALRNRLATVAHEQWSNWMKYLFSKGTFNEDGTWTMPAWAVKRWQLQMNTPYDNLPPEEKQSDLEEADLYIQALNLPNVSRPVIREV